MKDDLIVRQSAIDALKKEQAYYSPEDGAEIFYEYNQAIKELKNLPSAQQKPLKYTGKSICLYCQTVNCDGCMYEPMKDV